MYSEGTCRDPLISYESWEIIFHAGISLNWDEKNNFFIFLNHDTFVLSVELESSSSYFDWEKNSLESCFTCYLSQFNLINL